MNEKYYPIKRTKARHGEVTRVIDHVFASDLEDARKKFALWLKENLKPEDVLQVKKAEENFQSDENYYFLDPHNSVATLEEMNKMREDSWNPAKQN